MLDSNMNATNHVKVENDYDDSEDSEQTYLMLDDYDCIGFDLDHTLCRYNIGPMIRFEYDLLAAFLVEKRGYDPSIKQKTFDTDSDFVCKVLFFIVMYCIVLHCIALHRIALHRIALIVLYCIILYCIVSYCVV